MPRLYTREVFKQITSEGQAVLLKQLSDDAWVWGQNAASALSGTGALVSGVLNHYERDYIRAWDEFLDDLVQLGEVHAALLLAPLEKCRQLLAHCFSVSPSRLRL